MLKWEICNSVVAHQNVLKARTSVNFWLTSVAQKRLHLSSLLCLKYTSCQSTQQRVKSERAEELKDMVVRIMDRAAPKTWKRAPDLATEKGSSIWRTVLSNYAVNGLLPVWGNLDSRPWTPWFVNARWVCHSTIRAEWPGSWTPEYGMKWC